ncbi:hypothetical protein COV19_03335 [Candidatus Woesearchaeota archaeon CG10_big_fil_rev_8_21_14_0_10_44_13]|nr:MAG: hypothetical protein COV19_03335 [Candidatus Woesearchaeota archaeon CG10_big_fil_rev_8_21_14_0_10_44_13]
MVYGIRVDPEIIASVRAREAVLAANILEKPRTFENVGELVRAAHPGEDVIESDGKFYDGTVSPRTQLKVPANYSCKNCGIVEGHVLVHDKTDPLTQVESTEERVTGVAGVRYNTYEIRCRSCETTLEEREEPIFNKRD